MAAGEDKGKGKQCIRTSDDFTADRENNNNASSSRSGATPQTGDTQQNAFGLPTPSNSFQSIDHGKAPSTPVSGKRKVRSSSSGIADTTSKSSTPMRSSKRLRAAREAKEVALRAARLAERTPLTQVSLTQMVEANTDVDQAEDSDEDGPSPRLARKRRAGAILRNPHTWRPSAVPPATLQSARGSSHADLGSMASDVGQQGLSIAGPSLLQPSQQSAQLAPGTQIQQNGHSRSTATLPLQGNAPHGQLPLTVPTQQPPNSQPVALAPIPGYIQIPGHPLVFGNQLPPTAQYQPPNQPQVLQPQIVVHIPVPYVLPNTQLLSNGQHHPVGLAPIPGYIQIPGHPLVFNNQLPANGQVAQPSPSQQIPNFQPALARLDLLQTALQSPYANIVLRPVSNVVFPSQGVLQQVYTGYPPSHHPKPFSLLTAFLKCPPVILRLVRHLEPNSLLDLYAISKPFHFIMNSHFTTYIKESALYWSPKSNYIFPWRCYRRLTIKDPGFRTIPGKPEKARDVPSFRWLRMVCYRQKVIKQILENMAEHGHIFPEGIEETLNKMWFTMDLPRNGNRIGVLHQPGYWLNRDVFLASMFFMKLDMRLSDPVEGQGETHLRGLIFGSRNLLSLRDVLIKNCRTIHILRLQVWYDYRPSPQYQGLPIMGVPVDSIGRGHTEGWGRGNNRLLRVDEIVMREGIRRSLQLQTYYLDFVLFGTLKIKEVTENLKREKEERARYKREWERYEREQKMLKEEEELMLMLIRGEIEIESY
jgi:hypothetical protein